MRSTQMGERSLLRLHSHLPDGGQCRDQRGGGECGQDDGQNLLRSHAARPGLSGSGEISPSSQSCSWASAAHARAMRE